MGQQQIIAGVWRTCPLVIVAHANDSQVLQIMEDPFRLNQTGSLPPDLAVAAGLVQASPTSRQYVEMVCDPHDQSPSGFEGGRGPPDGGGGRILPMTMSARATFSSATGPRLLIQLLRLHASNANLFTINYSAAGAGTPTAVAYGVGEQWASAVAIAQRWRPVAMGLRIRNIAPADTAQGTAVAGQSESASMTAAATWNTYAALTASCWTIGKSGQTYTLGADQGITVRWVPQSESTLEFYGGDADQYIAGADGVATYGVSHGRMPFVYIDNFAGTLEITAVQFWQAQVNQRECAATAMPSQFSTAFPAAWALVNNTDLFPAATRAHSFNPKAVFAMLRSKPARQIAGAAGRVLGEAAEGSVRKTALTAAREALRLAGDLDIGDKRHPARAAARAASRGDVEALATLAEKAVRKAKRRGGRKK